MSPNAKRALIIIVVGAALLGVLIGGIVSKNPFVAMPDVRLQPEPISAAAAAELDKTGTLPSGFVVTNTLLSCWIASALILVVFVLGARGVKADRAPKGLANVVETVVEAMYGFVEGVAGHENTRKFFPMFATIFLFVTVNAWLGLLPIYPSLGFLKDGEITRHLLRPAGTDLNMPLALAVVSFVFVEFYGIRTVGFAYFGKFFQFGKLLHGNMMGIVDVFVGFLELLSELIRLVSFTFRLFGNMTAGEILLLVFTFLLPFTFPVLFYVLEMFVGFVQGVVFSGLTLVFVVVAVQSHSAHEPAGEHAGQ